MKNLIKLLIQTLLNNISESNGKQEQTTIEKTRFPELAIDFSCFKQKIAKIIGSSGCAFLCCIWIAEKIRKENIDAIQAFYYCQKQKFLSNDGYIESWESVINYLTGKNCTVIKTNDLTYLTTPNDFVVGCFEYTDNHFVIVDKDFNVIYDPLEKSNHVLKGHLSSLRVVKIED